MFKHVKRLLIVAGLLFLGCALWWVNRDETSSPNEKHDKLWEPNKDVPFLPDMTQDPDSDRSSSIDDVTTFLLLSDNSEAASIFEAIALVQYEPETNDLKLVSLENDLLLASSKSTNDSNDSGDQMINEIEQKFDLEIDHTIAVDLQGFIDMMDRIVPDGIEVTVTEEMREKMELPQQTSKYTLHGEELLQYLEGLNFGEQQEVLLAVQKAVKRELSGFNGIMKIPGLIEESKSYVETDMAFTDLVAMVSTLARSGVDNVEALQIPEQENINVNDNVKNVEAMFYLEK